MSYESYCASCTYLGENGDSYGKFYCRFKGDRYACDPKCNLYIEAYSRSSYGRENMYEYSRDHKYYITTTILNILKCPNNNIYLKTIRDFTNITLKQNMQYFPLLFAYEIIGPEIAQKLQEDKNRIKVAATMFYKYIKPTVIAIRNKETEKAIETYKTMTLELAQRYNVNLNIILPTPQQVNIMELKSIKTKSRKRILEQEQTTI